MAGAAVVRILIPAPRGLPARNAWLIAGPPVVLVDPGPATDAAYAAIRDAMAVRGMSIRDIERIVLTHAHAGHAGLAARLHADSGARVSAHGAALPALLDPRRAAAERIEHAQRAARAAGMPAAIARGTADRWGIQLADALAAAPLELPRSAFAALADREPLDARVRGTATDLGWTVHQTGGHSEDHIVLTHDGRARAITGDLVDRRQLTLAALLPTEPGDHRPSQLARLMGAWRDLARRALPVWLPAHGEVIRAPRVLVARRLAEHRLALQSARRVLSAEPVTAWEVASRLDIDAGGDAGRALSITIALLDWLVDRGHARRTVSEGAWRFAAADRRRGAV